MFTSIAEGGNPKTAQSGINADQTAFCFEALQTSVNIPKTVFAK
jgi:hypothetical protein